MQGVVQAALSKLPGSHSSLRAAGRTDAGVHALEMVAHIDTDTPLLDMKLRRALNAYLPGDVRILGLETVPDAFEAQYSCLWRYYQYRMRLVRHDAQGLALDRHRVLPLYRELDVGAMQTAALHFEGKGDFAALATQETRSTVREVYVCRLEVDERDLTLHIAANGFLRGMVRAVVGTLIRVGEGKLKPEAITEILESKDRSQAGENVAPHGLYFVKAGYKPWREGTF